MPSSFWKCLLSLSHFKNLLRHCAKTVFRHKHGLSTWYWDAYRQKSSFTGSFKDLSKSNHQLVKLDWRTLWMALLSHLFSPLPAQNPSPGWSPSQWGTGGEFLAGSGPAPPATTPSVAACKTFLPSWHLSRQQRSSLFCTFHVSMFAYWHCKRMSKHHLPCSV